MLNVSSLQNDCVILSLIINSVFSISFFLQIKKFSAVIVFLPSHTHTHTRSRARVHISDFYASKYIHEVFQDFFL